MARNGRLWRGRGALRAFHRAEDGALAIWSIFMFLMMLMVAALGVDLMLAETRRAQLQSTLDRAVLAAADLDQEQDPEAVVRSYLARAGLEDSLEGVEVTEGLNFRNVAVRAQMAQDTILLGLLGQDSLPIATGSTAEEAVNDIEISLVLDVSGSMRGTKLRNLKDAAGDFVETVFEDSEPGRTSISLVPYSTQVNAGAELLGAFNLSDAHDYSHCVDFDAASYGETSIDLSTPLQQAAHLDPGEDPERWRGRWYWRYSSGVVMSHKETRSVCPDDEDREILPLSGDPETLKRHIDAFSTHYLTSTEIGVKWGSALLDPSLRPVVSELAREGTVDPDFATRPLDHNHENSLKVMVVMSDGANTSHDQLNPGLYSGASDFWIDPDDRILSVGNYDDGFYVPRWGSRRSGPVGGDDALRMDRRDVWGQMSAVTRERLRREALYAGVDLERDWVPFMRFGTGTKDSRMAQACRAARDAGIVVYAIGFMVNDRTAGVLRDCASSAGHFFRVEGLEISDAFTAIARQVRQVRLVE
jgi:Flp pilus assembly protein TadG